MARTLGRPWDAGPLPRAGRGRSGPVVLGTLSVRFDPNAERVALESALDAHVALILANMITLRPYPTTLILAREYLTLPHEEALAEVRATAGRAANLGLETELLRITSRRPVRALLELVSERRAGLLVFGPDVRSMSRMRFRAASWLVRRRAPCLVWVGPDG